MGKRAFDMLMSTAALLALSPLFLVITIAIGASSPGPIFYRARRVGQGGREFKLYKFRSMVADADKAGPGVTTASDARITRIGHILRRTKLDELPQLINVLRGEMSIVGPRPEDPRYVSLYTPEQRQVLNVRPGISSAASVLYRNEEAILTGADWETLYIQKIMPAKLALDLEYALHPGLWRDLGIIVRTIIALFH